MTLREMAAQDLFGRPCEALTWEEHQRLDLILGIPEDEEPIVCLDGIEELVLV